MAQMKSHLHSCSLVPVSPSKSSLDMQYIFSVLPPAGGRVQNRVKLGAVPSALEQNNFICLLHICICTEIWIPAWQHGIWKCTISAFWAKDRVEVGALTVQEKGIVFGMTIYGFPSYSGESPALFARTLEFEFHVAGLPNGSKHSLTSLVLFPLKTKHGNERISVKFVL